MNVLLVCKNVLILACYSEAVLEPSAVLAAKKRDRLLLPDTSFHVPEPMNVQEEGEIV